MAQETSRAMGGGPQAQRPGQPATAQATGTRRRSDALRPNAQPARRGQVAAQPRLQAQQHPQAQAWQQPPHPQAQRVPQQQAQAWRQQRQTQAQPQARQAQQMQPQAQAARRLPGWLAGAAPVLARRSGYLHQPRLSPTYRAWRPLLTAALSAFWYLAIATVAVAGLLVAGVVTMGELESVADLSGSLTDIYLSLPGALLVLGTIALMIPGLAAGLASTGERPIGSVSSVAGRFRIGKAVGSLAVSLPIVMLASLIEWLVAGMPRTMPQVAPQAIAAIAILLPLQCAGEEYVFRGYIGQTVGSWLPSGMWWLAVAIQAVPFMLGHPYGALGLASVLATGLSLGWLAERTGGIEAGCGFHLANNACAFVTLALGVDALTPAALLPLMAAIDVAASALGPVAYVLVASRLGWLDDAAVAEMGSRRPRLFAGQEDRLMWERIQQAQADDWARQMQGTGAIDWGPAPGGDWIDDYAAAGLARQAQAAAGDTGLLDDLFASDEQVVDMSGFDEVFAPRGEGEEPLSVQGTGRWERIGAMGVPVIGTGGLAAAGDAAGGDGQPAAAAQPMEDPRGPWRPQLMYGDPRPDDIVTVIDDARRVPTLDEIAAEIAGDAAPADGRR